ncbi:MAG: hypothetical protein M5U28_36350 [Sandaracinaceae bacterium]|nr:hypothetical protein [Sandaracinaceae bacterium]
MSGLGKGDKAMKHIGTIVWTAAVLALAAPAAAQDNDSASGFDRSRGS